MTRASKAALVSAVLTLGGMGCNTAEDPLTVPGAGTTTPAAGTATSPAAGTANTTTSPAAKPGEIDFTKDIRGNCTIKTNYADDHACMPAPKERDGFQIHVGPKNHDDVAEVEKFLMKPGMESSECYTINVGNAEQLTYQTSVLSGRAGTHHIINTVYTGELPTDQWGNCGGGRFSGMATKAMPAGSLPGASKAYMPRGVVAPEYADVGRTLVANAILQADMHYFNFTDKDIIREFWMNLYYAPPNAVTRLADGIRGFGGLSWNREPIQPGTDKVYTYECPIKGNGHILSLLGHYHAHGKRFSASIKRASGKTEHVFEMFDYLDPATFEYNSLTENPPLTGNTAGAMSGPLAVADGDILQWECHVINDGDVPLRYINEVKNGEMCNIWGNSVGSSPIVCDRQ